MPPSTLREVINSEWLSKSIVDLLRHYADSAPSSAAIVDGTLEWSRDELLAMSKNLACQMMGIEHSGAPVILYLAAGSDTTCGILASLLAGRYSIIAASPSQLVSLVAKFPGAPLVLRSSSRPIPAGFPSNARHLTINLDTLTDTEQSFEIPVNPTSETPAHAVLTSGSTNEPKIVLHSHGAILNQIRNYTQYANLASADRIAVVAPLQSITGQSSLFGALLNGATACFYNIEHGGIDGFAQWLTCQKITVLHATPTVFRGLADFTAERGEIFSKLRVVRIGGEPITPSDLAAIRSMTDESCCIYLGYGCSEIGTVTRLLVNHESSKVLDFSHGVPVGKASENIEVSICDPGGNRLPDGKTGEVVIASRFLSLGYLGDEAQTHRAYSKSSTDGVRRYRTGDLGLLLDGSLYLRGRLDRQVKIRGHRIELDAVEAELSALPGFGSVAVEAIQMRGERTPPVTQLHAFLAPQDPALSDSRALRNAAVGKVSAVLLPAKFTVLPSLPQTRTGKIDRERLRKLVEHDTEHENKPPAAPSSDMEAWLLHRWITLLHQKNIGIDDDFFELGGNSMTAIRIFHEIAERTGKVLPVSILLETPTIAELAQRIEHIGSKDSDRLIVTFREHGSQPPLFLIHDIGGNVLNYRRLAQELGDDQPVYGIRSPALDSTLNNSGTLPTSVESLAALYIEAITAICDDRPIAVGGLSFGGKVAFEIAKQLHSANRQVAFLGLLDTRLEMQDYRPNTSPRSLTATLRRCSYHLRRGIFHVSRLATGKAEDDYLQERIRKRRKKHRAATTDATLVNNRSNVSIQDVRDQLSPEQRAAAWHRKLGESWRPKPSPVTIHYFSATQPSLRGPFNNMTNWSYLGTRGLQVDHVPGNHISLLEDPHTAILAKAMKGRMQTSTERTTDSTCEPLSASSAAIPVHPTRSF